MILGRDVAQKAKNGLTINDEMYSAAKLYAEDVDAVCKRLENYELGVEEEVYAPDIHEKSRGRIDCYVYSSAQRQLWIWDYKYGFGEHDPFENWALIYYACGLVSKFKLTEDVIVHLRIAQPRLSHSRGVIRQWRLPLFELQPYFAQLRNAALEAHSEHAKTTTGPHCRYCTARYHCKAALQAGVALFEASTEPAPLELSAEALGVQLSIVERARKQLEYVETGLKAQILGRLEAGSKIPGWKMESTYSRRNWTVPDSTVLAMGKLFGKDLDKLSVITPTQALKLGLDEKLVDAYSATKVTGSKLVQIKNSKKYIH